MLKIQTNRSRHAPETQQARPAGTRGDRPEMPGKGPIPAAIRPPPIWRRISAASSRENFGQSASTAKPFPTSWGNTSRRYRTPLIAAGLMLAVLMGGVVFAFLRIVRARHETLCCQHPSWRDSSMTRESPSPSVSSRRIMTSAGPVTCWKAASKALRGWEWRYLMRLLDGARPPLEGHTSGLWGSRIQPGWESHCHGEHRRHREDLADRIWVDFSVTLILAVLPSRLAWELFWPLRA